MKNCRLYAILSMLCLMLLGGCGQHTHEYAAETVPPSCETAGSVTYTCTCGDSYTETLPAPGHAWNSGTTVTEASCKEEGKIAYACTACKATREEVLAKTDDHTFAPGTVTKEATCGEEGAFTKICTVCAKEKSDAIAPTGNHTYGELSVTKAPTCKDEGEGEKICTVCTHKVTESVPKTDAHAWGTPTVLTAETCTAEGLEKVVCTVCEKEQTNVRPRSAHTYVSAGIVQKPDCATAGTESFRCTACHATKTETVPPTEKHAWNVGLVTIQPTCTQSGSKLITCTLCRAKKTEVVPASADAHTWDGGKVTKNPLCAIKGIRTYTCTACKEKKQEFIAPTGKHTYKKTVHTEPTEEKEGVANYICTLCNTSYMAVIPKLQTGTAAAPSTYTFDPYHLRTGHSDVHYVDFSISGSTLTVKGKIVQKGLCSVWINCGDKEASDLNRVITVRSGEEFTASIKLDRISARTHVQVYTHCTEDEADMYWSHVYNSVAVTKEDGKYQLDAPAFLSDNVQKIAARPKAESGSGSVSDAVQKQSDAIVKSETDVYKKIRLLYDWVTENIYYDYDYLDGKTSSTYEKPDDVLKNRRAVCVGYVNLLSALLRAQGISCHTLETLSVSSPSLTTERGQIIYSLAMTGHVMVEAYLPGEDRFILLDPTWDSDNRYEGGNWYKGSPTDLYFDASLEYVSYIHSFVGYQN